MQNPQVSFQKAMRKQAKARIAFCAPAGGGKTHSSLLVAAGLGGRIAVIDTENGSASLEVGKPGIPEFDVLNLTAPYTVEKYIEAMKAAESAGYDIIILDSISPAWQGAGGLLEQVDMKAKASKSGNSYTAWRDVTPMHNAFIDAILQSRCHVIATMRTKADYVLEETNGKKTPKKVGMAPIQREGMDYEFTMVFDIDQASHIAMATKDRTSLFDGKPFVPTVDTGKTILDWIMSGVEVILSPEQLDQINRLIEDLKVDREQVSAWVKGQFFADIEKLRPQDAEKVIVALRMRKESQKPPTPPAAPSAPQEAAGPSGKIDKQPKEDPNLPTIKVEDENVFDDTKVDMTKAPSDNPLDSIPSDFGGNAPGEKVLSPGMAIAKQHMEKAKAESRIAENLASG
jgi:hypothetical protein